MGPFDATCSASGLPLGGGDEVRAFLLTKYPYGESACEMHGFWVPRTFPIRARYNTYGSISEVEEGPLRDLWMRGLQRDLVEVGVGDNSVHDVAATRSMDFAALLDALTENRVQVLHTSSRAATIPEGQRRLASVGAALAAAGLDPSDYLIDEQAGGVRVRAVERGRRGDEPLERALSALQEVFAAVRVAGSGPYGWSPEVLCFMAPGKRADGGARMRRNPDTARTDPQPLPVRLCLIREDVWQMLLAGRVEGATADDYRAGLRAFGQEYAVAVADVHRLEPKIDVRALVGWGARANMARPHPGAWIVGGDAVPGVLALGTHAEILLTDPNASEDDRAEFLNVAAEFAFVHHRLSILRHVWRPLTTAGPQCSEWSDHLTYTRDLLTLIERAHAEEEAELAAWNEDT